MKNECSSTLKKVANVVDEIGTVGSYKADGASFEGLP